MTTTATTVVLRNVEDIVPANLNRSEIASWLTAPIGGAPLVRRIGEAILRLRPEEIFLRNGVVAQIFQRLWDEEGGFGITCRVFSRLNERAFVAIDTHGLRASLSNDGDGITEPLVRIDTPRALRAVAAGALRDELPGYPVIGTMRRGALSGDSARVARSVEVHPGVAVGDRSYVAVGAELGPGAVIGRDCYVGPGARIFDSVLLDGTRVEAGEVLFGVVRTPDRDLF